MSSSCYINDTDFNNQMRKTTATAQDMATALQTELQRSNNAILTLRNQLTPEQLEHVDREVEKTRRSVSFTSSTKPSRR